MSKSPHRIGAYGLRVRTGHLATLVCCLLQLFHPARAQGQTPAPKVELKKERGGGDLAYTRLNTWSLFGEYSGNSRHWILGHAEQRRLVTAGAEYSRRISLRKWGALYYLLQVRPFVLVGDPDLVALKSVLSNQVILRFAAPQRVVTISHALVDVPVGNNLVIIASQVYGRQWTFAEGLNPLGSKLNLAPHCRLQPVLLGAAGFLVSARDVPVNHSSQFNFSFEFGGGLEWFYKPRRSLRFDYRVHHISNALIGATNPGIDSGLMQLTYSFGR